MSEDAAHRASRRRRLPRLHPATVIALLALVMASGGTSLAGSVLNGGDLKNGTVSRKKIASNAIDASRIAANAVGTAKLAKGSVNSSKLAKGAVTAGALAPGSVTGPALGPGSVAGTNLAPAAVSWKSIGGQFISTAPVPLPAATQTTFSAATATATCPSGTVPISGGAQVSDTINAYVIHSFPAGPPGAAPTGWTVSAGTGGAVAASMTLYVICIAAGV
jgi:hypothetical protein